MANASKDTVYIDVDDEITTIIEKIQNSPNKIVALVLPKRASVLQSVVNMKLLKRSAEQSKKNLVLITSEAGLLPLAGAVGMHVASSLQSKPAIPLAPGQKELKISGEGVDDEEPADDAEEEDFDSDAAKDKPVGKLAGASAYSEPETIELDNEDIAPAAETKGIKAGGKSSKNKKLKIPNFNKFRLALILLIVGVLVLFSGFVWANSTLPRAVVTLKTDSTDVDTTANLTLDPKATTADLAAGTLPASVVNKAKTGSQQVSTTGQKNNGNKATGTVKMTAKICGSFDPPNDVAAGTGISSGGKTFITQTNTEFPGSGTASLGCITYEATGNTTVAAQAAGSEYNIAPTTFTVAGRSNVTAESTDSFTGGTDNIVKVVTQGDIDNAKQKVLDKDKDTTAVKEELATKLSTAGFYAISSSFQAGEPAVTPSAQPGDQTDTVSVSVATNYTLYGAKEADLKAIITDNVKKKIDTKKQVIIKDGFNVADYEITAPATSGPLQLTMSATSLAGPNIQVEKFTAQILGKKTGDVTAIAKAVPGVTDVSVKYSPFWVSKVPKKTDRVAVDIVKAND